MARGDDEPTPITSSSSRPDRRRSGGGGGAVMALRGDDTTTNTNDGWSWEDDGEPSSTFANHNSTALFVSSKFARPAESGGVGEPSLSEKLRQQELVEQRQSVQHKQGRRGPLLDSDHFQKKLPLHKSTPSPGGEESINSPWSWASSHNNSIRGKMNTAAGNKDGSTSNNFSILKVASSLPSPFKNSKRNMNMVYHAFGEEGRVKQTVLSAMNCTKSKESHFHEEDDEEEEDWENDSVHESFVKTRMIKIGLLMLVVVMGVFQIGRRRGHQLGEVELSFASSSLTSSSMNDPYLRGHLPSTDDAFLSSGNIPGSRNQPPTTDSSNTIIHHAIFPTHLSHLSNLTVAYNPLVETPYFWDVHFSGESVAEAIFSHCHGLVQACEFGLRQPDYNEDVSFAVVWC